MLILHVSPCQFALSDIFEKLFLQAGLNYFLIVFFSDILCCLIVGKTILGMTDLLLIEQFVLFALRLLFLLLFLIH